MIQVISILEKFYYSSVCFPFAPPRKHLGKNTQVRGHTSIAIRDVIPKKNVCFFISFIKGGGSFPFIKIYVADFV